MKCPHCHNDEVPAEAKFCPFCGHKIEESKPNPAPTPRLIVTTSVAGAAIRPFYWFFDKINLIAGVNELPLSLNPDLAKGFKFCRHPESVVSVDMQYFEPNGLLAFTDMFAGCCNMTEVNLAGLKTVEPVSCYEMFKTCYNLKTLDLSPINTSRVTSFHWMFCGCGSLGKLDVSGFDTSACISFNSMFDHCSKLENIDVSSWNTENVEVLSSMFSHCSSLRSLDLSNFRTPKCTAAVSMFNGCDWLEHIDMSGIDFSKCQTLGDMFAGCTQLKEVRLYGCNNRTVDLVAQSLSTYCPSAKIIR